jgi:hypothetical protein
MRSFWLSLCPIVALLSGGCPQDQRNPFLTVSEEFGASSSGSDGTGGSGGGGSAATGAFRRSMTLTLENTNPDAELNVSVAAWVNTGSIRSAEQQDSLIANGYVQLTSTVHIGTVYTLPPGTFVLNGPSQAGATMHTLARAPAAGQTTELAIPLMTPDVLLLFLMPPTSCDTPAFTFTVEGFPVDTDPPVVDGVMQGIDGIAGSYNDYGVKTLAQFNAYQCSPLKPGLFLKVGGGAQAPNEFFEGDNVRSTFFLFPDADGNTALITFE